MEPDVKDLDPAFLRFLLSKTQDAQVHLLAKQMGEMAASRVAVYALGRACLEREAAPPPLSAVLDSFKRVLLVVPGPVQKPAAKKVRKAAPTASRPPASGTVTPIANVTAAAGLTDVELRRELFQTLFGRLEAERANDQTVIVFTHTPFTFSLSRHGHLLSVDQGKGPRLMRIELKSPHKPWTDDQVEPWIATVSRTPDRARLALSGGPEGTIPDIVEAIVEMFLRQSER